MEKEIISKLKAIYDEAGIEALLQNLLQIAQNDDISQEDAKKLAKSFFDITAGGGDYLDGSTAEFFELIYQKFPKSKILKNYLIDIYGDLINNGMDDEYLPKMEQLIGKPQNESAAERKVDALKNRYYDELCVTGMEPDWEKCINNVNKIEEIFHWFPQNEYIALRFAEALQKLTLKQDIEACKTTVQRLENLLEYTKVNQLTNANGIVGNLTFGLKNLSIKQNEQESRKTISRIEEIVAQFPENGFVKIHLAYALETFAKYKHGKEREQIINRLMEISQIWEPAQRMADAIRNL